MMSIAASAASAESGVLPLASGIIDSDRRGFTRQPQQRLLSDEGLFPLSSPSTCCSSIVASACATALESFLPNAVHNTPVTPSTFTSTTSNRQMYHQQRQKDHSGGHSRNGFCRTITTPPVHSRPNGIISKDMIGSPHGDVVHTLHVGLTGETFGDLSHLTNAIGVVKLCNDNSKRNSNNSKDESLKDQETVSNEMPSQIDGELSNKFALPVMAPHLTGRGGAFKSRSLLSSSTAATSRKVLKLGKIMKGNAENKFQWQTTQSQRTSGTSSDDVLFSLMPREPAVDFGPSFYDEVMQALAAKHPCTGSPVQNPSSLIQKSTKYSDFVSTSNECDFSDSGSSVLSSGAVSSLEKRADDDFSSEMSGSLTGTDLDEHSFNTAESGTEHADRVKQSDISKRVLVDYDRFTSTDPKWNENLHKTRSFGNINPTFFPGSTPSLHPLQRASPISLDKSSARSAMVAQERNDSLNVIPPGSTKLTTKFYKESSVKCGGRACRLPVNGMLLRTLGVTRSTSPPEKQITKTENNQTVGASHCSTTQQPHACQLSVKNVSSPIQLLCDSRLMKSSTIPVQQEQQKQITSIIRDNSLDPPLPDLASLGSKLTSAENLNNSKHKRTVFKSTKNQ